MIELLAWFTIHWWIYPLVGIGGFIVALVAALITKNNLAIELGDWVKGWLLIWLLIIPFSFAVCLGISLSLL